jgi:probable phosphoglycerate mutase
MTADRLMLWRHGRTESNVSQRFQGHRDVPLDDLGQVQVKDAAEQLTAVVMGSPCRIVSSDLSRAHDTALALAARLRLPVAADPALREICVGSWEGLLREEVRARDPEGLAAWRSGADIRPGGGELRSEVAERAERAIRVHVTEQDGGVLVVASHGAALRGAILRLIGIERWSPRLLAPLRNAHWAQLDRCDDDGWILSAYNVGPLRASVDPQR